MSILGSTDFLGNPFGFFADVSEGVSELVHEGSVGGLVWNVTHGMANSTAKVTGKLFGLLQYTCFSFSAVVLWILLCCDLSL